MRLTLTPAPDCRPAYGLDAPFRKIESHHIEAYGTTGLLKAVGRALAEFALFSDAEPPEDFAEQIVGGELTGDAIEFPLRKT